MRDSSCVEERLFVLEVDVQFARQIHVLPLDAVHVQRLVRDGGSYQEAVILGQLGTVEVPELEALGGLTSLELKRRLAEVGHGIVAAGGVGAVAVDRELNENPPSRRRGQRDVDRAHVVRAVFREIDGAVFGLNDNGRLLHHGERERELLAPVDLIKPVHHVLVAHANLDGIFAGGLELVLERLSGRAEHIRREHGIAFVVPVEFPLRRKPHVLVGKSMARVREVVHA